MCFGMMKVPFAFVMGAEQREQCPAVSAWFAKIGTLPVVTMVTGTNSIAKEAYKCCGSDLTVTVAAQVQAITANIFRISKNKNGENVKSERKRDLKDESKVKDKKGL